MFAFFFTTAHLPCSASNSALIPWRVPPENHCIAPFFFFFFQTYKQPHPLHRHIFNSVITPQGDETAVQPPAETASSVRSFLWDSAGVGGVRLHSPTVAGTEGRRGGSCDSLPFVKGHELAVSPRRLSSPSIFALFISPGFQLATMRGLPLSSASNLVNLFPGRPRG